MEKTNACVDADFIGEFLGKQTELKNKYYGGQKHMGKCNPVVRLLEQEDCRARRDSSNTLSELIRNTSYPLALYPC